MKHENPNQLEIRDGLPPRPLSEVLSEIAGRVGKSISVANLRDELGDRGFAALLVIFAAVNLLPLPPGTSAILGIPLIIVSAQMVLGRQSAWLPEFILQKSITHDRFAAMSGRVTPKLKRLERIVQPRYWPFSRRHADKWIGTAAFVLAIAVTIPIPFGNWLPAFAIAILGIALSERDGILLSAGIALGVFSLAVIGGVVGAAGAIATAVAG